jgi:tRNA A37 threonylcarbamoyladenosine synthetase subunit TsaC/SUA5/YrdC
MRDPLRTRQATEGIDLRGAPVLLEVEVRADGRITLTSSTPAGEPTFFSAERAAQLRNQLGDALTISLREARTARPEATS